MESFLKLPRNNQLQAEYIWIDLHGNLRSKSKTLPLKKYKPHTLPLWDFDGSSTGQATGNNSEVILKPQAIFKDPFRVEEKDHNLLVMCDTYYPNMKPHATNTRFKAQQIFNKFRKEEPWFGLEQEFFVMNKDTGIPYGFGDCKTPPKQGQFYCGVGTNNAVLRDLLECHYRACLYAGIKISGVNFEVCCSQMEYQVGPCVGIASGDQLWTSRYILQRVAERFDVVISFEPKPIEGVNGSGCHCNFSTRKMRDKGGYEVILSAIEKLGKTHQEDVKKYGKDNDKRLTGKYETSSMDKFSSGVANRGASVRIPRICEKDQCGYFEDRRPASNMDPYVVTSLIAGNVCCL